MNEIRALRTGDTFSLAEDRWGYDANMFPAGEYVVTGSDPECVVLSVVPKNSTERRGFVAKRSECEDVVNYEVLKVMP